MPKMKTLMPDDEAPGPDGPAEDVACVPARATTAVAGGPVADQEWLRELARPCEEPVVRTDSRAPYVGFASARAATWEPLRQLNPKVHEGDPFVAGSDG